jgi:hypothetical protein
MLLMARHIRPSEAQEKNGFCCVRACIRTRIQVIAPCASVRDADNRARRHSAEMNGERAEQETRAARLSSTFTRYGHPSHLTDTEISTRQPILGSFCSGSSSSRFWDDIAYAQHVEAEQDQHGHCTIYVHTVLHDRTSRAQIHGRFACFVPSV